MFFFVSFAVPPVVKAVNQLVGAPVESDVVLECIVEVYPKPLNGWYRNDGKNFILLNFIFFLLVIFSLAFLPFFFKDISILISAKSYAKQ